MTKFKILVFTLPASGHVNPLLPILNELNKYQDIEIVVYLTEEFRNKFESINVRFKALKNFDFVKKADFKPFGKSKHFELIDLMTWALRAVSHNFDLIAQEIDNEKPNLIIYDTFGSYIKWAIQYYVKSYSQSCVSAWPMPPMIGFSATFVYNENVYPNKIEQALIFPFNFRFFYDLFRIFFVSFKIGIQFGLGLINPLNHLKMKIDNHTKLIVSSIFPELHPRSHLYDRNFYKFVGTTIEANILIPSYLDQMNQEPFKSLFEIFPIKEIDNLSYFESELHLVFVSLGTLFNNNFDIFKKIIDAFKTFDEECGTIRLKNLRVIVSTGEKCFGQFRQLIESKSLKIPDNIYIVKSAPQIEILKRASLFVTHSGMNSTSESIHFAGIFMLF